MQPSKRSLLSLVSDRVQARKRSAICATIVGVLLMAALAITKVHANTIPLGDAANYAVLYEGTGGHNLQITNITVNGNIGVGGTGAVQFNGPGTINGALDFSAAQSCIPNCSQYSNNNGSNVGPTSVTYSDGTVTSALSTVNSLSSNLAGLGSSLSINGTQTVNESTGQLDSVNGVMYRVFKVTSYSEGDGNVVIINGDGSGDPVVFDFGSSLGNVNLGGDVTLNGLTDDQVLWNFTSSGNNIQLNNNASSYKLPLAFQGIILAPNDAISLVNANIDGRVFGGDSSDMQIVSGDTATVSSPISASEPGTPELLLVSLAGSAFLFRRRFRYMYN